MQPNIFMAYRLLFGGEIVIIRALINHMKTIIVQNKTT